MPGLDLCAAGLCRQGSALLPEKGNQAAAAQGRIHLGRGAVENARRPGQASVASAEPGPIITDVALAKAGATAGCNISICAYGSLRSQGQPSVQPAASTVISGHNFFHRAAFAA